MTDPIPATRMSIARGTLHRRIHLETAVLGEMVVRGNHKNLSYQSGLVDGLNIAAALTQVLDQPFDKLGEQASE